MSSDPPAYRTRAGGSTLYVFAAVIFFWAVFDGLMGFITPLVIAERGISDAMLGFIIGTSSIAGLIFDLLLTNLMPRMNYRRIFAFMFLIAALFPLVMWVSETALLFVLGMVIWGMYYDLYRLGTYDFLSRRRSSRSRASSFGVVAAFAASGYFLAPLIAGFLIDDTVGGLPFVATYIFLGLALALYVGLLTTHQEHEVHQNPGSGFDLRRQLHIWTRLGRRLLPVLLVTLTLNIIAAFYWTIGPLLASSLESLGALEGLFMSAVLLPALLVGGFVGTLTDRFGQKRTAVASLFLGSLFVLGIGFAESAYVLLLLAFVSSFFFALSFPAMSGAYADYVAEARPIATEITTIEDAFTNMGYIIGPIAAGLISEFAGYQYAFTALGVYGAVIALIIWRMMPQHINVAAIAQKFE
jgi:MFS family permease